MTAEEWNSKFPIDTPVRFWPMERKGEGRLSRTRSEAWTLSNGDALVNVYGYVGGIALTHVEPLTEDSKIPDQTVVENATRLNAIRDEVLAYGENNLGTDVPFWFIAMNSPHGKVFLAGIWFSQEDAAAHLEAKRHRYPKSAHTWCAGAVDSPKGLRKLHALLSEVSK